jgi:hypothetical protein
VVDGGWYARSEILRVAQNDKGDGKGLESSIEKVVFWLSGFCLGGVSWVGSEILRVAQNDKGDWGGFIWMLNLLCVVCCRGLR